MRGEGTPPLLDLPGPGHKHGGAPWQTTTGSKELQGASESGRQSDRAHSRTRPIAPLDIAFYIVKTTKSNDRRPFYSVKTTKSNDRRP